MMKQLTIAAFVLFTTVMLASTQIQAADAVNGEALSRQCSVCHGKTGMAKDPTVPNLAGQSALYLEKSMKDFRSGARANAQMTLMAQNLSDDEIKDLAAFYASFIIEVSEPE